MVEQPLLSRGEFLEIFGGVLAHLLSGGKLPDFTQNSEVEQKLPWVKGKSGWYLEMTSPEDRASQSVRNRFDYLRNLETQSLEGWITVSQTHPGYYGDPSYFYMDPRMPDYKPAVDHILGRLIRIYGRNDQTGEVLDELVNSISFHNWRPFDPKKPPKFPLDWRVRTFFSRFIDGILKTEAVAQLLIPRVGQPESLLIKFRYPVELYRHPWTGQVTYSYPAGQIVEAFPQKGVILNVGPDQTIKTFMAMEDLTEALPYLAENHKYLLTTVIDQEWSAGKWGREHPGGETPVGLRDFPRTYLIPPVLSTGRPPRLRLFPASP